MKNHTDATGFKESNAPSLLPVCTSSKITIEKKLKVRVKIHIKNIRLFLLVI